MDFDNYYNNFLLYSTSKCPKDNRSQKSQNNINLLEISSLFNLEKTIFF